MINSILKNLKIFLFLPLLVLSTCTQNAELKKSGIEAAKLQLQVNLKDETNGILSPTHPLYNLYIGYVLDHSDFSVSEVFLKGKMQATLDINISTLSPFIRNHLIKLIAQLQPDQIKKFNIGEAVKLIEEKTHSSSEFNQKIHINMIQVSDKWVEAPK